MKKFLVTMMLGLVAGLVFAQEEVTIVDQPQQMDINVSADAGFYSAYVWRGQILNDGPVLQPAATVSSGPLSARVWANYNIDGRNGGDDYEFTETDLEVTYALPIPSDDVSVGVGYIRYIFPGSGPGQQDTGEFFASVIFNSIILTPVFSLYYDHDQNDGWYGSLDLSHTFELSDALSTTLGATVGANDNEYDSGWADYNIYASADYTVTDNIVVGGLLEYTMVDGGVRGKNMANFGADNTVWGGLRVAYSF